MNYHIHQIASFGDSATSLRTSDYRDLMLNTIFIPCPRGGNLDTFRLYEALECGCIPIIEKKPYDYFKNFYGTYPFLAVDSWNQAPAAIQALLANQEALEGKRVECYIWWQDYKKNLNEKFIEIINSNLEV